MKTNFNTIVLAACMSLSGIITLNSCSKTDTSGTSTATVSTTPDYVETTLLNRNLVIPTAKDNGVTVTDEYQGYRFYLAGKTSGSATAVKDGVTIQGTFSRNISRNTISFDFPPVGMNQQPMELLNQEWVISSGSNPVKLTAASGQNDEVYFAAMQ